MQKSGRIPTFAEKNLCELVRGKVTDFGSVRTAFSEHPFKSVEGNGQVLSRCNGRFFCSFLPCVENRMGECGRITKQPENQDSVGEVLHVLPLTKDKY